MEKDSGYMGFGSLDILKRHLTQNEIICHPLLDYLSGNVSTQVYVPSLYISGTNILKLKYQRGN